MNGKSMGKKLVAALQRWGQQLARLLKKALAKTCKFISIGVYFIVMFIFRLCMIKDFYKNRKRGK